ncbi:MAG: galactokinase [Ruminococcus sp.]|nr:galactokinase [Ruminococcus sp.]
MDLLKNVMYSISSGEYDKCLFKMYATENLQPYKDRFLSLLTTFGETFGFDRKVELFSASGRTEIGGNHTDHQLGKVMAGSVNLDIIAVASKSELGTTRVKSVGYPMDIVSVDDVQPIESEKNTSASLIRGVNEYFINKGFKVGAFDCCTTSSVLKGSGLSSSASFEVLIGNIVNDFYAESSATPEEIAIIGQYAENRFFGKPCGLMDQMASSVGGIISIDFYDKDNPKVIPIDFDFSKAGYSLCIIDSGADHSDLTDEYANITKEMKLISNAMGVEYLSRVDENHFYNSIEKLRKTCPDRAILRAIHFFNDNRRVSQEVESLQNGNLNEFFNLIKASGRSSYEYLQNVYPSGSVKNQAVALVLALCEKYLHGMGAYRVHGGGFAGTVQAFVPNDMVTQFKFNIEKSIGENMCHILNIRSVGGLKLYKY